jgi:hypothetical protein
MRSSPLERAWQATMLERAPQSRATPTGDLDAAHARPRRLRGLRGRRDGHLIRRLGSDRVRLAR